MTYTGPLACRWFSRSVLLSVWLGGFGCAASKAAANNDPQRCERDPACSKRADKSKDCVTQCVDDPACIDRCRLITNQFR